MCYSTIMEKTTNTLPRTEGIYRTTNRAVGIVVDGDKLLVMHRKKEGKEYWVFPGGGVEEGETSETAVVRELQEETNLQVKIIHLLYCHHLTNNQGGKQRQDFYLCEVIGGNLGLRDDSIEAKKMAESDELYEPLWITLEQAKDLLLYPLEIRDWLLEDLKNGLPTEPRVAHFRIEDLRQTI